jgi:hypothetical protein
VVVVLLTQLWRETSTTWSREMLPGFSHGRPAEVQAEGEEGAPPSISGGREEDVHLLIHAASSSSSAPPPALMANRIINQESSI